MKFRARDLMIRVAPGGSGYMVDLLAGAGDCDDTNYCDNSLGCTRCSGDPSGCYTQGTLPAFACFDSEEVMFGTDAIDPLLGDPAELAQLQSRLRERMAKAAAERTEARERLLTADLPTLERMENELLSTLEQVQAQRSRVQGGP